MLSILGLLTGLAGPIAQISNKIADLLLARAKAKSDTEIARINQDIEAAHDRKAILVAEAGNRVAGALNASMRMALAVGPLVILLKLFVWDKVVGSVVGCRNVVSKACETFVTDKISPEEWLVIGAVIAFYFGYDMISKSRK